MVSCTKVADPTPENAKFVGTWNGEQTCTYTEISNGLPVPPGVTAGSFVQNIGAADSKNGLTLGTAVGSNNCYIATWMTGTAIGYNFTAPKQDFTDNCGTSYLITSTGILSTVGTLTVTTTTISAGINIACTFVGTKK